MGTRSDAKKGVNIFKDRKTGVVKHITYKQGGTFGNSKAYLAPQYVKPKKKRTPENVA